MTDAELKAEAEASARFCRSGEREGSCPFLSPGSGVSYEDCPMRPRKCGRVTAKMWYEAMRDALQFCGELEED